MAPNSHGFLSASGVCGHCFAAVREAWWPQTLAMLVAGVLGGYVGALAAKRMNPRDLREAITAVSFAISAVFFLRHA
jgi:uncharacterized membrane protein YfcA